MILQSHDIHLGLWGYRFSSSGFITMESSLYKHLLQCYKGCLSCTIHFPRVVGSFDFCSLVVVE